MRKLSGLGAGAAVLGLAAAAMAQCTVQYTDIRGIVSYNGVPVAGAVIEPFCCDTCTLIPCANADPHSQPLGYDTSDEGCHGNSFLTNYLVSFNSIANGGNCNSGCSTIAGISYGGFCPLRIFLRVSYNGCTNIVSCDEIAAAYASCGQAVIDVDINPANCGPALPPSCAPPPPPPCVCVDSSFGLGPASTTTVLELGASQVSINGPAGGILGSIYIAPGGKANFSGGGEYLVGNIYLGAGAQYQNSGLIVNGSVLQNQNISAQIAAAYAANSANAALPCTQTIQTLDGKTVTKIVGGHGLNVICVKDIALNGTQIALTGFSDSKFVFNVTGKFALNGGGAGPQIRVDASVGLQPSDVLFNLIGTGEDVAFTGGGGGVNCCAAIVDGTILAPYRKINLSPGLVNGEIISGLDINIVSGSSVRCPCH